MGYYNYSVEILDSESDKATQMFWKKSEYDNQEDCINWSKENPGVFFCIEAIGEDGDAHRLYYAGGELLKILSPQWPKLPDDIRGIASAHIEKARNSQSNETSIR